MSYENDTYEVPWKSHRWDLAILEQENISFLGAPGRWVLYRPERLIVRSSALDDSRVREALSTAESDRCEDEAVAVAAALGLELLRVPEHKVVEAVRRINELARGAASLNHVAIAGPHYIGGDDDPENAVDPGDIPGSSEGAGEGVRVLVLDTGCAAESTSMLNISDSEEEVADANHDGLRDPAAGHGTHLCGIIARCAPGATIIPRRLLDTAVGAADDLAVARELLEYGMDAHVINCSFTLQALDGVPPVALQEALARLPRTTVVVAGAGNSGTSAPHWPAAFERVVSVGAVGQPPGSTNWVQADFTNFGSWVACCAPGVKVVSTFLKRPQEGYDTGFACWSGTSMATPMVAGTIAAMASRDPEITAAGDPLATRVSQAADAVRALPPVGAVGAFVAPPGP